MKITDNRGPDKLKSSALARKRPHFNVYVCFILVLLRTRRGTGLVQSQCCWKSSFNVSGAPSSGPRRVPSRSPCCVRTPTLGAPPRGCPPRPAAGPGLPLRRVPGPLRKPPCPRARSVRLPGRRRGHRSAVTVRRPPAHSDPRRVAAARGRARLRRRRRVRAVSGVLAGGRGPAGWRGGLIEKWSPLTRSQIWEGSSGQGRGLPSPSGASGGTGRVGPRGPR